MKYVYGPVPSWRLGRSLGVDLVSGEKTCSFECNYCQLGRTVRRIIKRQIFVPTNDIVAELEQLPSNIGQNIDYVTLSGTGEPTLASNLGEVITEIKKRFNKPVAVLTNSTMFSKPQVRQELALADLVVAKLDAPDEGLFQLINRPARGVTLAMIISGLSRFQAEHPGKLALQVMIIPDNKDKATALAELAKKIKPVEVQLNTPLRPCPVKPLSKAELEPLKELFAPLKVYTVYDVERPDARPMDEAETKKRRPVKDQHYDDTA